MTANTGTAYVWSTGSTAQTITVNTSGNYKVIVTQSNGCTSASAVTSVTVGSAPTPTISANGSTTLCAGGSVVLTASSGTAYLWSNGATTNAITASTAGNYTVRVTQSNGCSATSAVTAVTIGSAPTPTISASGPTTLCTGGNVTLTASTGTAYLWSNGATTNSITTSSAGNYSVRVTQSGGCSATSAITTVSIGAATTPTISASGPTTFCSGGNVTLTASTGTAYLWSNGATTNAITVSSPGNYTVRVTQSGGCSATSAITTVSIGSATTPTISASGPTTFCSGGNVTLTASTGTAYLWSNGATTNAITVSSAGSYTVRVTQSGGCSATSGATTITIGSAPTPTISANGPTSFCSGGSVTLTASSGTAYLWSNGATTNSINVTAAGNYTVRVSQTGGCSATSAATTITIGTGNAPTPTINAGGSLTFCQGGSVTLNASSGTAYLWSNGATTQSISATTGGNYTVRVTQSGGCFATSSATTVTVRPSPTFTVTPNGPLNFCQGCNVTFNVTNSNATFYIWYKNNNLAYWGTRNYYTASSAGVYKLRAYLGLCSTYSNSFNVTVPCREGEVLAGEPMFIAYPNPFSNNTTFAFELAQASEVSIRLFDATGKLIDVILEKSMVSEGETRIDYATTHLSNGIYMAEIITPEATKRIKLVSKK
ncbi:MAG: T9SS type A sorting domain-containing protein [Bacteroidetes bacterium]|nr:T9SS type A sorting domain-containing protein [Bacteroidota bacterium]